MSGIAGIVRFDGGAPEPGRVERMTAAIAHRGPDGLAHWQGQAAALGHCMFRTTPESLQEVQPLANGPGKIPVKEFRETQKLLTYRFLYSGPPGTQVLKWIPALADSTALAGKDSVATKASSAVTTEGPPPAKLM